MSKNTVPVNLIASWQEELNDLVTSPEELISALQLPKTLLEKAHEVTAHFPLRVPRAFLKRVQRGNPDDPLLLQILPLAMELDNVAGYNTDPLAETHANPVPGIIHKYYGRVLFIGATQCAVNCRYCFRRHFNYRDNNPSRNQWQEALAYVREHPEIDEIILSGGDPLCVSDKQIAWFLEQCEGMPQITRIRIHSRLPIVLPSRINDELLRSLEASSKQIVMVIHCNHPNEIDTEVSACLSALLKTGVTLLNQTVLLKSVNDSAITLTELSKRLFIHGVLPYYLHLLDKVSGTAHFDVAENTARTLYKELQAKLPGYLVPKMVREIPGENNKTLIY